MFNSGIGCTWCISWHRTRSSPNVGRNTHHHAGDTVTNHDNPAKNDNTAAPNQQLRKLLNEAGWRPETFAKRILDHGRQQHVKVSLHDKTPYHWLRNGQCPRDPVPLLAATVLSEQLGRPITPADLGWHPTRSGIQRADDGLTKLWFPEGALLSLQEVSSNMHRRGFLVISGSALTTVAHQWMVSDTPRLAAALDGHQVDDSLVTEFERVVDARRRMDDEFGGGALYEAVTADLRLVTRLLSNATYPEALGQRLYAVAAELARLAGWACHDTGHEGAAQRYWSSPNTPAPR